MKFQEGNGVLLMDTWVFQGEISNLGSLAFWEHWNFKVILKNFKNGADSQLRTRGVRFTKVKIY
jgi:hypothetical protein